MEACNCCYHGSLNWEESVDRSGMGGQEAGEGVASSWWGGSLEVSHAGLEAFLPWDPHDPDGKT